MLWCSLGTVVQHGTVLLQHGIVLLHSTVMLLGTVVLRGTTLLHGWAHHPLLLHLCVQLVQKVEVDANCESIF